MNIIFSDHRQIEINYVADILNIKPASGDVCGYQHLYPPFFKILNGLAAFVLTHIAMQCGTFVIF